MSDISEALREALETPDTHPYRELLNTVDALTMVAQSIGTGSNSIAAAINNLADAIREQRRIG